MTPFLNGSIKTSLVLANRFDDLDPVGVLQIQGYGLFTVAQTVQIGVGLQL
jgi:hypothetical protein